MAFGNTLWWMLSKDLNVKLRAKPFTSNPINSSLNYLIMLVWKQTDRWVFKQFSFALNSLKHWSKNVSKLKKTLEFLNSAWKLLKFRCKFTCREQFVFRFIFLKFIQVENLFHRKLRVCRIQWMWEWIMGNFLCKFHGLFFTASFL